MDTQMAPLGASCIGYELFGLRRKRVTSSLDCMEGLYQNQHMELARSQGGHIQNFSPQAAPIAADGAT
jgi:hypothetical protein